LKIISFIQIFIFLILIKFKIDINLKTICETFFRFKIPLKNQIFSGLNN
jgi:hypothetical protein